MDRIAPQKRDEFPAEKSEVYDKMARILEVAKDTFIVEDSRGALIGPVPFFLYSGSAGQALIDLMLAISKLGLPSNARETAILTVGGQYQAGFELYSHEATAVKAGVLTKEQTEPLKKGIKPEDLNEQCSIAYDVAKHLSGTPGPLPQHLWDASLRMFGKDATVGLIHYIGFYCYTCVVLNAVNAAVPGS